MQVKQAANWCDPIRPPLVPEGAVCQLYGEATVCMIDRQFVYPV
jgi:hypothetical protein